MRLDVARGLLIVCVAVGHLLERSYGWQGGIQRLTLTALYAFHMPAFVFFTGVVAKSDGSRRRIVGLLSVLVCFQSAFLAFRALAGHPLQHWYWPYWVLWYLMAMIWWQFLVPLIRRWPKTFMAVSCATALAAGLGGVRGEWFSYQRTLVFLPFFVLGCAWGQTVVVRLREIGSSAKVGLASIFSLGVLSIFAWHPDRHWLFNSHTYEQLHVTPLHGMAIRAGILLVGAAGTALLVSAVSESRRVLAWLGQRTLPVFVFHGFLVLVFAWAVAPEVKHAPGSVLLAADFLGGLALALLFATKPPVKVAGYIRKIPQRLGIVRVPAH